MPFIPNCSHHPQHWLRPLDQFFNSLLVDLPKIGALSAVDEWVYEYVCGLLLLLLERYSDARDALFVNLSTANLDPNATGVLRLGAAVSLLRSKDGVSKAAKLLESVPAMKDTFAEYVRDVLALHVATSMGDQRTIAGLLTRLSNVNDSDIKDAVEALRRRDWRGAWQSEVRALLRLAA